MFRSVLVFEVANTSASELGTRETCSCASTYWWGLWSCMLVLWMSCVCLLKWIIQVCLSTLFRLFVKLLSETSGYLQQLEEHMILQVVRTQHLGSSHTHRLPNQCLVVLAAKLLAARLLLVLFFNRGRKTFHGHPRRHLAHPQMFCKLRRTTCEQNHVAWKMFAGCCLLCSVIFVCGLHVFGITFWQLAEHVDPYMWQSLGIVKHSGTWQWQAGRWKQWL